MAKTTTFFTTLKTLARFSPRRDVNVYATYAYAFVYMRCAFCAYVRVHVYIWKCVHVCVYIYKYIAEKGITCCRELALAWMWMLLICAICKDLLGAIMYLTPPTLCSIILSNTFLRWVYTPANLQFFGCAVMCRCSLSLVFCYTGHTSKIQVCFLLTVGNVTVVYITPDLQGISCTTWKWSNQWANLYIW